MSASYVRVLDTIIDAGATAWQIQLTVPMGNAADDPSLILQPYELASLMPELFAMFRGRSRARLAAHSRQQHRVLRSLRGRMAKHFGASSDVTGGCQAGRAGLGIEADGAIKGCPSLPTQSYVGGNIRDKPLSQIWKDSAELGVHARSDRQSSTVLGLLRQMLLRSGLSWRLQLDRARANRPTRQ